MSNRTNKPFEPAAPDPGMKPGGIRMRALCSPERIRQAEIAIERREGERQHRMTLRVGE
jgi:hypothetical protein